MLIREYLNIFVWWHLDIKKNDFKSNFTDYSLVIDY